MMAAMRASRLMRAIDKLPYRERVRLLAAEARRLSGTGELDQLLDELGDGDAFHRSTGVTMARVAGHPGFVLRMLADPDPALRDQALAAVRQGVQIPDHVLISLYDDAPADLRRRLLHTIRAAGRTEVASRLVDRHRERWGDRAAAGLLPVCDAATVRRLLPELGYCLQPGQWRRLAVRHAEIVLAHAGDTLAAAPDAARRERWWASVGWGVVGALDEYPHPVLELIEHALPPTTLPAPVVDILGRLTDIDAQRVLAMLTRPDRAAAVRRTALTPALRRRLARFSDDQLAALGRILWAAEPAFVALLDALPPSRRATVFADVTASLELSQLALSNELLDVLPHGERHRQARRMLAIPAVRESLHRTWQVTARLPYDEAFAQLAPEVRRPEAADRAAVYHAVLDAAGRSGDAARVREALEWATQVRNDRDPVRQAVLGAAAAIPPSLLADDQVPVLDVLLTDALEARDTGWGSTAALTRLAETAVRQGVLGEQPDLLGWGLRAHEQLAGHSGSVRLYGLTDGLPRGREVAVFDALRPHLEAGAERDEFELTFSVAGAFGRRGWRLAPLHGLLERAILSGRESTVDRAVRYWLEPPATRGERVAAVLALGIGMARWDPVWDALTDQRTDLLDVVFARPQSSRRFERDHPRWQVRARSLRRWLPRQQARFAELLTAAAGDARLPEWARANAVLTLGRIPTAGRTALERFTGHPEVPLAEAALAALAWTDRPDLVLPALLAHAGDDRARVALYAATRAARFVRPSALGAVLRPVLTGDGMKVTSRKEAARLLGELRVPGAAAIMAEAWPAAHRDVRAAIASAASQYLLYDDEVWPLLETAVTDSDATARVIAARMPVDLAEGHRPRYGRLVLGTCAHPDRDVAAAGIRSLRYWGPWVPEAAATCASAVTDLDTPSHLWSAAVSTLAALVPVTGEHELVRAAGRLAELDDDPRTARDAGAEQDRPSRRWLSVLVSELIRTLAREDALRRGGLRAAADALAPYGEFLPHRVELLVAAARWHDLRADLNELTALVTYRPLLAERLARQVDGRLRNEQEHWQPDSLRPLTEWYAERGDLAGGLLAVVLTERSGSRLEWPAAQREQLAALRRHPDADVRSAALAVTTASA